METNETTDAPVEDTTSSATEDAPAQDVAEETTDELLAGKFKEVPELERSYKELESSYGKLKRERAPEAPESYDFSFENDAEFTATLPEGYSLSEDPLVEAMSPIFKDANLTQEQVDKITKGWIGNELASVPNAEEEMSKLGSESEALLKGANSFLERNFTEEERGLVSGLESTADGIRLLNKMASIISTNKVIPTDASTGTGVDLSDLRSKADALRATPHFKNKPDLMKEYDGITRKIAEIELRSA